MRQKSFIRYFFRLWGWLALVSGVLATIAYLIASHSDENAQRLQKDGVTTTAELLRVYRTEDRDTDGRTSFTYRAEFRFTADGRVYTDKQTLSYRFYQTIGSGQRVPVRYWAKDPSISEIEPGATATWALYASIATLILGGATLAFLHLGWQRARLAAWLFRHGVEDSAVVTNHVQSWLSINDRARWRAEFRQSTGQAGATYLVRQHNLPPVGTVIYVLADPQGHRNSVWSGDL
jgi:hypothetical protein